MSTATQSSPTATSRPVTLRSFRQSDVEAIIADLNADTDLRYGATPGVSITLHAEVVGRDSAGRLLLMLGFWMEGKQFSTLLEDQRAFVAAFCAKARARGLHLGSYWNVKCPQGYDFLRYYPILNPVR